jgi:hypothetical protein
MTTTDFPPGDWIDAGDFPPGKRAVLIIHCIRGGFGFSPCGLFSLAGYTDSDTGLYILRIVNGAH